MAMLILTAPSTLALQDGETGEDLDEYGQLYDVRIITAECLENATCEPTKPTHLVEYFSADWCEPCHEVSNQLANMTLDGAVVLQHHGSPADATFVSASKLRYDLTYRLLFLPALVMDGEHLLTGTRQAMDLTDLMANTTSNWTGFDSIEVASNSVHWNTSLNGTVRAWYAEPTPHTEINTVHSSLARSVLEVDAAEGTLDMSNISVSSGGFVVLMLERDGVRTLSSASLAPTGLMELNEGDGEVDASFNSRQEALLAVIVTVFLLALVLPALVMQRSIMKHQEPKHSTNSTAEE